MKGRNWTIALTMGFFISMNLVPLSAEDNAAIPASEPGQAVDPETEEMLKAKDALKDMETETSAK